MGPCGTCRKTAQQAFKLRWTTASGVWTVITVHGGRTAHHGVALEGGSAGGACAHVKCFGPLWPSRGLRMRVTTTAVGTRSVLALVAVFVLHAYRCHSLKSLVSGTRFAYDTVVIPPMVRTDLCHASHYIRPDRTTSSIRVCQYKGLCDCIDSYELLPLVFHSLVLSARGLRYMSRR